HLRAKVVELGAVHVADGPHLDLLDLRGVQGERPLDADAERVLPHRERLTDAGALTLDHDPLEHLHAAPLALDHLQVDAHRAAQPRQPSPKPGFAGLVSKASRCLAEADAVGGPVDRENRADEVISRHRSPPPAVTGGGAVVAHEEVPTLRDDPATTVLIASAGLDVRLVQTLAVHEDEPLSLCDDIARTPD